MRQAILACRLLEESKIAASFIPRSIWRVVRAKDKVAHPAARGWGSLSAPAIMAETASTDEELLVTALSILSIAFCQRIGETLSIRVQDIVQSGVTAAFFNEKRPATDGSHVQRVLTSADCSVSSELQPYVSAGGQRKTSSRVDPELSRRLWSASLPTKNSRIFVGTPGAGWAPPCSFAMVPQSRSLCHGAAGDPFKLPAATSPAGMIAPRKTPPSPDLLCSPTLLAHGASSLAHTHHVSCGPHLSSLAEILGNPMAQTGPTHTPKPIPSLKSRHPAPPPPPHSPNVPDLLKTGPLETLPPVVSRTSAPHRPHKSHSNTPKQPVKRPRVAVRPPTGSKASSRLSIEDRVKIWATGAKRAAQGGGCPLR